MMVWSDGEGWSTWHRGERDPQGSSCPFWSRSGLQPLPSLGLPVGFRGLPRSNRKTTEVDGLSSGGCSLKSGCRQDRAPSEAWRGDPRPRLFLAFGGLRAILDKLRGWPLAIFPVCLLLFSPNVESGHTGLKTHLTLLRPHLR